MKTFLRKLFKKYDLEDFKIFEITKSLGKVVKTQSRGKFLDVGCGTGEYFPLLNASHITGLDLLPDYLSNVDLSAYPKDSVSLVVGDIRNLPFPNESFDTILCAEVFECLSTEELPRAFGELERVCSKNGVIIISVPNKNCILNFLREALWDNKYGKSNEQYTNIGRVFTKEELKKFGFEVHGCYGYISRREIGFGFLFDILDFFAWYFPNLGGTLIGINKVNNKK